MKERVISFCYRKVIDASSNNVWDKYVFEDSFAEFRMQAQYFNQDKKHRTYAELIRNVKGAERLDFLVSAAVVGYVQQLQEIIPDVLNNLGRQFLKFKEFKFEIINSDIDNIAKHQIAINFFSEPQIWLETIGNYLLISPSGEKAEVYQTNLIQLIPFLNIQTLA